MERDKFLTEAMEIGVRKFICTCDIDEPYQEQLCVIDDHNYNESDCSSLDNGETKFTCGYWKEVILYGEEEPLDFSTWEGFGKLLEWAQEQNWYQCFIERYGTVYFPENVGKYNQQTMWMLPDYLIGQELFADAVYEFLNSEEGKRR